MPHYLEAVAASPWALVVVFAVTGLDAIMPFMPSESTVVAVAARLGRNRRSRAVHEWVQRLLHSRGGLIIVFARYLPGGRSTTAFAASVGGYPLARFRWYTVAGVLLWATQAALIGYRGGRCWPETPCSAWPRRGAERPR
jgi:membrane protein DedA with SNARE-associated domain